MYLTERGRTIEASYLAQKYCKYLSPASRQMSSCHGLKYLLFDVDIVLLAIFVLNSILSLSSLPTAILV